MEHRANTPPTDYAKDVARRARQLASSEQVDWKSLSQDERKQFKKRVRDEDKAGRNRG